MKIFLSYASEQRAIAEPLALALEAEGHDVFFDRHDLPLGDSFHDRIRQAIDNADRCIFLVSPQSIEPGSYALTELALAQARWPRPAGRVLPVMAQPTPFDRLPAYLGAVTVMQPRGNLVAEVAAHFAKPPWWRQRTWLAAATAVVALAGAAGWQIQQRRAADEQQRIAAQRQRAQEEAQRLASEREAQAVSAFTREVEAAVGVCSGGDRDAAWTNFEDLAPRAPTPASRALAQSAQADCAMAWLRNVSVPAGQTFESVTSKLVPLLGREVAVAQGQRLGDLNAHMGWAEYLRWRDGKRTDPPIHYRRAIEADPRNPYANAMWAHNSVLRRDATQADVDARFATALAAGRERPFVRYMQAVIADIQGDQLPAVLRSLDEGRRSGEPAPRGADALYRLWCERDLVSAPVSRRELLAVFESADDAIATIAWLQPLAALPDERKHLWHLCGSAYLVNAGRHGEADAIIRRTLQAMGKAYEGGSWERWAKEQLARFKAK